jgi:hypothetical protein
MHRRVSATLTAFVFLLLPAFGIAAAQDKAPVPGSWRFEKVAGSDPALSFVQDGKVLFRVSAGRTIGLWIAYPGAAQPNGKAQVTIQASSRRWRLNGELTNEHDLKKGDAPATYFVQRDLGLTDRKKRFGDLALRYNRFMDALIAAKDIVITTKAGVITLPAVGIADARQQMQL